MTLAAAGSTSRCFKGDLLLIAGGVYAEACVTPARVALLGSGGRAALALVGLSDNIELHTFHPRGRSKQDVALNFEPMGVSVTVHAAPYRHIFEYLHPLARPRIVPLPSRDVVSVAIEAREVLRFGCLEGDFRVTAKQAVYDPRQVRGSPPLVKTVRGRRGSPSSLTPRRSDA